MHRPSALLALLTSTALARPTTPLTPRDTVGVYLCNDKNFTGYCRSFRTMPSECVNLASDLNDQLSSVTPDPDSFCYFFIDPDCTTKASFFHVANPGVSNLAATPVNGPPGATKDFEDKLSSYFCVAN